MGKSCWMARLAIQILLIFPRFQLLPKKCYISNAKDLKPGSSTYPFPALSISGIHKMPDIKFKGE